MSTHEAGAECAEVGVLLPRTLDLLCAVVGSCRYQFAPPTSCTDNLWQLAGHVYNSVGVCTCSVIIGSFAALGTLAASPRKWNKLRGFVARIAAMQKVLRDVHDKASDLEVHDASDEFRNQGALRRTGSRVAAEQVPHQCKPCMDLMRVVFLLVQGCFIPHTCRISPACMHRALGSS